VERFGGNGQFGPTVLAKILDAYQKRFGAAMPISANGERAVHWALGFDRRGRVDVALNPHQPEGMWLRRYLTDSQVPIIAFRAAVADQATEAHVHLGPPSMACTDGTAPMPQIGSDVQAGLVRVCGRARTRQKSVGDKTGLFPDVLAFIVRIPV
jgi:hypothetical protein